MPISRSEDLKYGWRHGGKVSMPVAMAASQTISAQSGKFIFMTAGAATLNVDASSRIYGFLEAAAGTPTVGDVLNAIIDLTAIFRIPVDSGTFVIGMVGDSADLAISVDIQGAQLDASDEDTIIVVGGDVDDNNFVDVMMSSKVWGTGLGV